jgi:hypothetical protein
MSEAAEEVAPEQFLGSYSQGDGAGYNLYLELKDGKQFECEWRGCLGVYGTASGRWVVERDGLNLATEQSDGMFTIRPLGQLRVVSLQGHYLFFQEKDRDWFTEYGPDTFRCFHQENARTVLQRHWLQRLKARAKE